MKLLSALFLCLVSAQLNAQNEGLLNLAVEEDSGKVFLHFDQLPAAEKAAPDPVPPGSPIG